MFSKIIIALILSFFSLTYAQKPDWVDSPMKACKVKVQICAVGVGSGRLFAEQNALKSLASYFESQIKGSIQSEKGMSQKSLADEIVSSEVDESVQTAVATFTDQVLEGALVESFYEDDEYFYALAVLDKVVAAKKLKTEIQSIDERLKELLKENKRTTYAKLKMRYKLREKLNKRYEFLKGRKVPQVVSFAQISKKKALFLKKRLPLYVKLKGGELTQELEQVVKKFLIDQNYKILERRGQNQAAVLGNVEAKKLFLQVKGWEKHRFIFSLHSENKNKQKIGAINFMVTKTGINKLQALGKALPDIKKYLEENIVDLNLE